MLLGRNGMGGWDDPGVHLSEQSWAGPLRGASEPDHRALQQDDGLARLAGFGGPVAAQWGSTGRVPGPYAPGRSERLSGRSGSTRPAATPPPDTEPPEPQKRRGPEEIQGAVSKMCPTGYGDPAVSSVSRQI